MVSFGVMGRLIISIFIVLSPVLASQSAVASVLPCQKMAMADMAESMLHTVQKTDISGDFDKQPDNCGCDESECHASHSVTCATLFSLKAGAVVFDRVQASPAVPHSLQVGIYTPPFRPPIVL